MRIAFISFIKEPWGGSEVLWGATARHALALGHEAVISAIKVDVASTPLQELEKAGAKVFLRRGFINPKWDRNTRILNKARIWALNILSNPFRDIIRQKPDVLVFTGACYSMVLNKALFRMVEKHRIPLVLNNQVNIEYTRPIDWEQGAYLRRVYQYASLAAFVSRRNMTVTERHLALRLPHAAVIRNPVNLSDTTIIRYPSPLARVRLAIVANLLVNHKGHDLLLEVLSQRKWKDRDVDLHIYGSGTDEGYIRELVTFFGLEGRVFFHGKVTDIRAVWAEDHLLVMPSLNEGMALSVVEAMICGRPVVTTDVGGNMEWITEGSEGFIAEGANTHAFDNALERAWQRRMEWEEMGKRAHARAMELHDPEPFKTFLNLILEHGHRP